MAQHITEAEEDAFWAMVRHTARRVFKTPADDRIAEVEAWVRKKSLEERDVLYHSQPLHFAADILRVEITPDHVAAYRPIHDNLYRVIKSAEMMQGD